MIQHICLSQHKVKCQVDVNEPIELIINAKDFNKFEKILKVLFDRESVTRIKKIKEKILPSLGSHKLSI